MSTYAKETYILVGLLLMGGLLLAGGLGGATATADPALYDGQWPTYVEKSEYKRGEVERLYHLGTCQSYGEVGLAELAETVLGYLSSIRDLGNDPLPEYEGPTVAFTARIEPLAIRAWCATYGAVRGPEGIDGYGIPVRFRVPSSVGGVLPCAIGVPCVYVDVVHIPAKYPDRDFLVRLLSTGRPSVCRVWGEFEPEVYGTDSLPTTRQIVAHKAIVVGMPPQDERLRTWVDRAIGAKTDGVVWGTPLADIYVYAAQAFPEEKAYAENAVREIERLLSPTVPESEKDPSALSYRGSTPHLEACWEKRYFFLLGWVHETFLQDYEKAFAAYHRVYTNYREAYGYNDDAMVFSARILARTGKTSEAQELYFELLEAYPDCFWAADARAELNRLRVGEKPGPNWPGELGYSYTPTSSGEL